MKFSAMPLVTCAVFAYPHRQAQDLFVSEWRQDKTVVVRRFTRRVRAGGTWSPVMMVVVRRKV